MARRGAIPPAKPPALNPQQGLQAIEEQLNSLQKLKGRRYTEAEQDEEHWYQFTERIIELVFGNPHSHLSNFHRARGAGDHYVLPMDWVGEDPQAQPNYEARIQAYETVLKSAIAEIKLFLPQTEPKGIYEVGDEYAFYRDLKEFLERASKEVFLIDNYLNREIFDLYAGAIQPNVLVRVLTLNPDGTLLGVAQKYARRGNFELRGSPDVHDRVVFVDGRCWIIGQSIKDAAKKKPTYMIEHENPSRMLNVYEDIWNKAKTLVKN